MASPCPLVVVDTSAAIEILVPEAVCHNQYTRMMAAAVFSDSGPS